MAMNTVTVKKPVLILGSAPNVVDGRDLPKSLFSSIVAINNAWRVRDDWDCHVAPDDFPADRMPPALAPHQRLIRAEDYVPANNAFGGIVYAGATMAFSAGYWALQALAPSALVFLGCDMMYPNPAAAHFYGAGTADPLRDDVTLRSLEAKSARLMLHAAMQGCACVRAGTGDSRLVFPATPLGDLGHNHMPCPPPDAAAFAHVKACERDLGYMVESGRYWECLNRFSVAELDVIDEKWLSAAGLGVDRTGAAVA